MSYCRSHVNEFAKHRNLRRKKGIYWKHVGILPESSKNSTQPGLKKKRNHVTYRVPCDRERVQGLSQTRSAPLGYCAQDENTQEGTEWKSELIRVRFCCLLPLCRQILLLMCKTAPVENLWKASWTLQALPTSWCLLPGLTFVTDYSWVVDSLSPRTSSVNKKVAEWWLEGAKHKHKHKARHKQNVASVRWSSEISTQLLAGCSLPWKYSGGAVTREIPLQVTVKAWNWFSLSHKTN